MRISFPFPVDLERQIEDALEVLEAEMGLEGTRRACGLLTATEFGLSEVEMLELLMPTSTDNGPLLLDNGVFNFATFCTFRRKTGIHSMALLQFHNRGTILSLCIFVYPKNHGLLFCFNINI